MRTVSRKLNCYRALWGVVKQADGPLAIEEAIPKIAKAGYVGIECPIVLAMNYGIDKFGGLLKANNLKYLGMVFTDGPVAPGFEAKWRSQGHPQPKRDVGTHLDIFRKQLDECMKLNPVKINSHSGNDYMTRSEMEKLFSGALEIEKKYPVAIMHETHRKRALHSAWVTRDVLPSFPQLKIVADLSHWICVAETNAQDPVLTSVIEGVKKQVYHIHGRVGYDHGPQVPDPRDARWKDYVSGHEAWWRSIFAAQLARGDSEITFTPEHGPPNYQVVKPHTNEPLADIWDVNSWVADRVKADFDKNFPSK